MKIKICMGNDKNGKGGSCLWNKNIKGLFLAAVGQDKHGPRQGAGAQGCVLFGPLSPPAGPALVWLVLALIPSLRLAPFLQSPVCKLTLPKSSGLTRLLNYI